LKRLEDGSIKSEGQASIIDCETNVWRIAWNATGTVLATCGDDGKLKLWRKNFKSTFECIQEMEFGDESLKTHYNM
jgi:nucleoporin SEH1